MSDLLQSDRQKIKLLEEGNNLLLQNLNQFSRSGLEVGEFSNWNKRLKEQELERRKKMDEWKKIRDIANFVKPFLESYLLSQDEEEYDEEYYDN
jgi:hypothetical protein